MSPEAQRIAIAEWCGYTTIMEERFAGGNQLRGQIEKRRGFWMSQELPDYINDLNAMHEACQKLKPKEWWTLDQHLERKGVLPAIKATAGELAEALLRTIGKWQDAPQEKQEK